MIRTSFVLAIPVVAAACGGGGGGGSSVDAGLGSGVHAVPLGSLEASSYTAAWTASGSTFTMLVDTGSVVTAVAGTACSQCVGLTPLYSPGSGAADTGGSDSQSYEDNTGWSGEVWSDTVGVGHGTPNISLKLVDITSQSTNPSFFEENQQGQLINDYQGILGMAPASLLTLYPGASNGETAFAPELFAAGVDPHMAFELCPTEGTMWLGGFDASHAASELQYSPILTDSGPGDGFYDINVNAMAFGSADLGATKADFDEPVIDTGTSLMYIPTIAENNMVTAINASSAFKSLFPGQTMTDPGGSGQSDTGCVQGASGITDAMVEAMMPPLTLTIDGGTGSAFTVSMPALGSYLFNAGSGEYCSGVAGGGDQGDATFGDVFMGNFVIDMDFESTSKGFAPTQVGFAPTATCPATADVARPSRRPRETGRGPHHNPRRTH